LRLALANLHRPGAPTTVIVLSLGFGLTLLGALALIAGNVRNEIAHELPRDVPALFMIDIQKSQAEDFDRLVRSSPGVSELNRVANIRGRIVRVAGKPAAEVTPKPDSAWVLRGDQGLTTAAAVPPGSKLVAGEWWPPDYTGPPLLSLYEGAAESLGVKIGDTLTLNILGRDVEARIANLRSIDWSYLGFNYVIVYSPGALDAAPFNYVANVRVSPEGESALYRKVTHAFPNVSVVRSRDALAAVVKILDKLSLGVGLVSLVTLIAGALVLAGAVAAGYHARIRDAVILKVVGATRAKLLLSYLIEFGTLGATAGTLAAILSGLTAFLIVRFAMGQDWTFLPGLLGATLAAGIALTAGLGLLLTFKALGERPAKVLRSL
jgi:putative ABC transport system permease protein